jgi:hypothetical protein
MLARINSCLFFGDGAQTMHAMRGCSGNDEARAVFWLLARASNRFAVRTGNDSYLAGGAAGVAGAGVSGAGFAGGGGANLLSKSSSFCASGVGWTSPPRTICMAEYFLP